MDKELIKGIIKNLRDTANNLENAMEDEDDLECEVYEAQHLLLSAGRVLKEML